MPTRAAQAAAVPVPTAGVPLAEVLGGQRIRRLVASGRLAHANLLVGPRGSGRRTAAGALAGALLCLDPRADGAACDACPSCRALAAGSHPDVHVLAGHRLEHAKALTRAASLRPAQGGRAVFILPDVDQLTPEAVAALLKPIEEPPAFTVFILTAISADHVPETIVSRCQVVPLLPAPLERLVPWLIQRDVPPGVAEELAEAAGGRPGRALALARDPAWRQRRDAARTWLAGASGWGLGDSLAKAAAAAEATDLGEVLACLRQMAREAATSGDRQGVQAACAGFEAALAAASALDSHVSGRLTWEVLGLTLRRSAGVGYNRPKP